MLLLRDADGELLAALAAATPQDFAPCLRAHPLAKAMGPLPALPARLVRPLHEILAFLRVGGGELASPCTPVNDGPSAPPPRPRPHAVAWGGRSGPDVGSARILARRAPTSPGNVSVLRRSRAPRRRRPQECREFDGPVRVSCRVSDGEEAPRGVVDRAKPRSMRLSAIDDAAGPMDPRAARIGDLAPSKTPVMSGRSPIMRCTDRQTRSADRFRPSLKTALIPGTFRPSGARPLLAAEGVWYTTARGCSPGRPAPLASREAWSDRTRTVVESLWSLFGNVWGSLRFCYVCTCG